MRKKKPKRRVQVKARQEALEITSRNDCWSMDFVADQLFTGQKFRVLTMVDIFSRLSPQIGVGFCYKSMDVVKSLDKAIRTYGKPKVIRVDNGPEFIAKALDLWAYSHGVTLDFSRPGKPTGRVKDWRARVRTLVTDPGFSPLGRNPSFLSTFPVPARQTGRALLRHPAFI